MTRTAGRSLGEAAGPSGGTLWPGGGAQPWGRKACRVQPGTTSLICSSGPGGNGHGYGVKKWKCTNAWCGQPRETPMRILSCSYAPIWVTTVPQGTGISVKDYTGNVRSAHYLTSRCDLDGRPHWRGAAHRERVPLQSKAPWSQKARTHLPPCACTGCYARNVPGRGQNYSTIANHAERRRKQIAPRTAGWLEMINEAGRWEKGNPTGERVPVLKPPSGRQHTCPTDKRSG